jgi:hypothetical protein
MSERLAVIWCRSGELLSLADCLSAARFDRPRKSQTAPKNPANRMAPEIVEKVLHLRTTYMSRLPGGPRVRKIHTQRYQKQVPVHQIQVDVKFLKFEGKDSNPLKRYQYTAIDDATRIRAL